MTLLVAWIGVDTHGTASAYIAADSRLTWGKVATFDLARKVYGLEHFPDIFGYCGDVLFPTLVLGQISEMADAGLLFDRIATPITKSNAIMLKLGEQFEKYPADVKGITQDVIQVLHVSRNLEKPPVFKAYLIEWRRAYGWSKTELPFPVKSGMLSVLGSGAGTFHQRIAKYEVGPTADTSRAMFHCFCQTVMSGDSPGVGGAPQLVGLYRGKEPKAVKYGIIVGDRRYIFGASIEDTVSPGGVEWRNELFEICDGATKQRRLGAQPQPDTLAE